MDAAPIEFAEDFKYLGDIHERCKVASRAYDSLVHVWKATLRVQTKLRLFKAMVEPVMCNLASQFETGEEVDYWFRLIRQIVNCSWLYVRRTDESILKHVGHAHL